MPVADPGFPRGGSANPQDGGANLLFGQKFPKKYMKMKRIRTQRGASLAPPLDPPMHAASPSNYHFGLAK